MRRAFTLIEVVVSVVVVGLIFGIVIETYTHISDLTWRVEGERIIQSELLYVTQTMQSMADQYSIDFERYRDEGTNLAANDGFVTKLYMTNDTQDMAVYASGNHCAVFPIEQADHIQQIHQADCILVMDLDGERVPLTDGSLTTLSHLAFKIVPFENNQYMLYSGDLLQSPLSNNNRYEHLYYPGFWMLGRIYHKKYGRRWPMNTKYVIHQYYSLTDTLNL